MNEAHITMESVDGETMYRIGKAYFPHLTTAILAAFSVGMKPTYKG